MHKNVFIAAAFTFMFINANAQYPVAAVPDSLKKNAHTVIRLREEVYELKSPGKATMHEHEVFTILNDDGSRYAHYNSSYDKFNSINYIDARLYDAAGKEIKHVKKKDMADVSGSDDETLMTDTRYKACNMEYGIYPYTVDFDETDDFDGIRDLAEWLPEPRPGVSVQESRLVIITPKDYVLRYKQLNFNAGPVITDQADKKVYTWEIKNVAAKESEAFAPEWHDLVPYVIVEPSEFEIGGYRGNMSTWEDFGKFVYSLNQGKDVLPDAVKQKVHQIADNVTDPREKIKLLYNFLQQNTRYINISFGIGGWQPFDANYVFTKKYGDCKALSNCMVAILKEAGIKANYVLIRAGEDAEPMMADFPCSQFNHATVCVPLAKDTMWLECTNQTLPAGYIGEFTGNRQALLIDENGGHVVSTKRYTIKDNKDITTVNGEIDETGKLTANITNSYAGFGYFDIHSLAAYYSKEEQLKRLKEEINLATYDVTGFSYDDHKSENPVIDEHIQVVADGGATVTGKRLFFSPNFLTQSGTRPQASDNRKYDVDYEHDYTFIDSLSYKLPNGYTVEAMAKDVNIDSKFGKYSISFKVDGNKLNVVRIHSGVTARFPPSEYNNLVKFYDDMYKADRSKIVFVKKDN